MESSDSDGADSPPASDLVDSSGPCLEGRRWDNEEDQDGETDFDEDDAFETDFARGPPALEADAPSASFSVSNPLRGLDGKALVPVIVLGLLAAFVRWRRRRKRAKQGAKERNTWAWKTGYEIPSGTPVDLSRPLLGSSLAIGEKCASESSSVLVSWDLDMRSMVVLAGSRGPGPFRSLKPN